MSRPKKIGLSYFPFDVDFFSDTKIKRLRARFGTNGIAIYIFLLCEIYRRGYYIVYDDDTITDVAYEFNLSENLTRQIMNYLFSRSLLMMIESKLAVPVKVITARSVQLRYQEAKKLCKTVTEVDSRFWVLNESETESCIKLHPSGNKSGKSPDKSEKNEGYSKKNHTNESKVNKSKVNESKVNESKVCMSGFSIPCKNGIYVLPQEDHDQLTHTYPDMDVDKSLDKLRKYLTANPHKQGYVSAAKGYIDLWLGEDDQDGKYRKECSVRPAYDLHEYEDSGMLGPEWDESG